MRPFFIDQDWVTHNSVIIEFQSQIFHKGWSSDGKNDLYLENVILEYVFMITKHNHEAISWSHVLTQIYDTWNHYIPISQGKPAMLLQTAFTHKHPDLFSVSYSPNHLSQFVC